MALSAAGVIQGYPDGTFRPEQTVNRVEAIKMIFTAISVAEPTQYREPTFNDIQKDAWYFQTLRKAFSLNIVQGYPDGSFKPAQTVNLVENLKIMLTAGKAQLPTQLLTVGPYNDAPAGQWYTPYVYFAKEHNLITGDAQNNIHPSEGMSRAKLAETLYRYKQLLQPGNQNNNNTQEEEEDEGFYLNVKIKNSAFKPDYMEIAEGTKVKWTNDDTTDHTVTSDTGKFESTTLSPGESFFYTFTTSGTFTYHCSIHPGMVGTIVTKAAHLVPTI